MRFKQAIEEWTGLRYVSENLELLSGMSRRHLNNCMLCTQKEVLEKECDVLDFWTSQFTNSGKKSAISELLHLLSEVLDITGTIKNIEDGVILGDVELYEVKHLAMVSSQIRLVLMSEFEWTIPDLKGVVSLLDPDDLQLS